MKGAAGGAIGDLARARLALDERGQRLGELDEKTASMMASAEAFSKHAHEVWVLRTYTWRLCPNQGYPRSRKVNSFRKIKPIRIP